MTVWEMEIYQTSNEISGLRGPFRSESPRACLVLLGRAPYVGGGAR